MMMDLAMTYDSQLIVSADDPAGHLSTKRRW